MGNSLNIFLRGAALLAFLVAMPLCALPVVGNWYDAWLLNEPTRKASQPTVNSRNLSTAQPATQSQADENSPPDLSVASVDELQAIPRRLEELGAEYLRLEAVADPPGQFRFQCRVALAENSTYVRLFEACAPGPVAAMQRVLDEVELWRGARTQSPQIQAAQK